MFNKNLKLFTAFGVPVKANISFLGILLLILVTSPSMLPLYAIAVPCILIHEFGHVLTARHFGSQCTYVSLNFFGGVALIDHSKSVKEELAVALAGPATSLLLGLLFYTGYVMTGVYTIGLAAVLNLGIGVFNMVPAYPMDGGRVLKASMEYFFGARKGLTIAVCTSLCISLIGVAAGLYLGIYMLTLVSLFIMYINYQEWKMHQ